MTGLLLRHDVQEQRDHLERRGWTSSPLGLMLPPRGKRRYDRPTALDTFSGAGGFGCGFHQAGYHVVGATEWWHRAAATYLTNLARPGVQIYVDQEHAKQGFSADPGPVGTGWIAEQPPDHPGCEHFWLYDIRNLTGAEVLDKLGLDEGELDVITGGPPCQGYSTAGRQDVMDPRNSLVFEFARLVLEIRPRTFVMENVPGMLQMVTPEGVPVVDMLCKVLDGGGYGAYDALRKALVGKSDARVGVRGAGRGEQKKRKRKEEAAEDDGVLFDLGAS